MAIQKDYILLRLQELEEASGGYFGTDINNLAKELGVTYRALQKRLKEWLNLDPTFANFHYLGKHRPSITLDEFAEMTGRISANPLEVKSHIRSDLNEKRTAIGKQSVAKTTFYRGIKQTTLFQFCSDTPYLWFERKGIRIPPNHSIDDARKSLSKIFTFARLKAYGVRTFVESTNGWQRQENISWDMELNLCNTIQGSSCWGRISEIFYHLSRHSSKKIFRRVSSSKYKQLSWSNAQTFLLTNSSIGGEKYSDQ
jgi:hypothetical protein